MHFPVHYQQFVYVVNGGLMVQVVIERRKSIYSVKNKYYIKSDQE